LVLGSDERILLAGRSGCGKSTLLKVLSGIWPTPGLGYRQGSIFIGGRPVESRDPFAEGLLGLLLQSPEEQTLATTVRDEINLSLRARAKVDATERDRRCLEAMRRHGVEHLAERRVDELSGGERQGVVAAAFSAMDPTWLFYDEPFAHADGAASDALQEQLAQRKGKGLLVAEHRLDRVLPHVERVILMAEGRILLDAPRDQALANEAIFERAGLPLPLPARLFVRLGREERPVTIEQTSSLLAPVPTPLPAYISPTDTAQKTSAAPSAISPSQAPLLRLHELSIGHKSPVLSSLSASAVRGERIAILGANGVGKSTLLATITGLLKALAGRVEVQGRIGLVGQRPELGLFCPTVADELRSSLRRNPHPPSQDLVEAARRAGLDSLLDAPPWSLSRGQRLRLAVQAQLRTRPDILLLDEPTAGQDPQLLEALLEQLTRAAPLLLFTTHDLSAAARTADRTWLLGDGGLLFDGTPQELLARPELCRRAHTALPIRARLCAALGYRDMSVDQLATHIKSRSAQ